MVSSGRVKSSPLTVSLTGPGRTVGENTPLERLGEACKIKLNNSLRKSLVG